LKFTGGAPHAYNEFEPVDAAKKSINLGIEDLQKQHKEHAANCDMGIFVKPEIGLESYI